MEATVRLSMASSEEAEIIKRAMSVGEKPGSRSSVLASSDEETLILAIDASDIGALRAALNSSLREVKIADSVLQNG